MTVGFFVLFSINNIYFEIKGNPEIDKLGFHRQPVLWKGKK